MATFMKTHLGYNLCARPLDAEFVHEAAKIGDSRFTNSVDMVDKPIEGEIGELLVEALNAQLGGE